MSIKDQFKTIKNNWLITLLIILVLVMPLFSNSGLIQTYSTGALGDSYATEESAYAKGIPSPGYDSGFAPESADRKITTALSLASEIKRGEFKAAEDKLKSIISSTKSFLLNENVNRYGEGLSGYYYGTYQLKVETAEYSAVVSQFKELGEVTSFNENKQDITESYTNLQIELTVEKERLARYKSMYAEAQDINDKINLNDRIFEQERTIKYLEDSLRNVDERVDYSAVYLTLVEKQSVYLNIGVVKLSQLIRSLVNSFNTLLTMLFVALPYGIIILLGWWVVRKVKKT
ncbi:MAG TPA: DUF4349 domain-containing protein [Candidatus Nanoarchaeia archaeon]|nr:DUF4349 domain-containing protein [Candidatus Nanoarchaeia archaeon]